MQEKQLASFVVFVCVLFGGVIYKESFFLPALPARTANIWRYRTNVPRQLL